MSNGKKRKFKVPQPLRMLALLLALPAMFEACLVVYCTVMMFSDKGPIDHYWSCGVLIYLLQFLIAAVFALPFALCCIFLQAPWNDLDI
jgi:hypothetical protein